MLVREKIMNERKQQGLSLESLASMLGVDKGTLSRYETGKVKKIPKDVIFKTSEILKLDLGELVSEDPQYCTCINLNSPDYSSLPDEDIQLLTWFHALPTDVRKVIKQFWTIHI